MVEQTVEQTLDVREIEGEPFGEIMAALEDLGSGQCLRLVNDFEPKPLYNVLTERGFTYETDQVDDDVFHVDIRRDD